MTLASSDFLASAARTRQLQDQLLGWRTGTDKDDNVDQCLAGQIPDMPEGKAASKQKECDRSYRQTQVIL